MKIGFQGTKGAYSQEAVISYFGKEANAIGFDLSEQVVEALESKEVDFGVLPVENSIVGNVAINLDMFYTHNIFAIGEIYLPIHHCLLAPKGTKLEEIESVHSHPIALAQCRDFLNRHNMRAIADFDTAGACRELSNRSRKNEAAIASRLCADYYNVDILNDDIQKVKTNITRFLVFVRSDELEQHKVDEEKTSLAFSTKHHPGALLNCLQTFKNFNLNLAKLESRPIPENPFEYIFFVDILAGLNNITTQQCLTVLKNDANNIKVFGSYPQGLHKIKE